MFRTVEASAAAKTHGQGGFFTSGGIGNVPGEKHFQPGGNTGLLGLRPGDEHAQTLKRGHGFRIPQGLRTAE